MRKLFLCSAALALLGGAASAADIPTYDPAAAAPIMAPTSAFSWTGFYAGLETGYAWGDVAGSDELGGDFDADGFLVGAFAGYNMQFNSFVVGGEADLEWTGIDGSGAGGTDLDVSWQGSLRARAGFALDQFLIYGTAGLAFADIHGDASVIDGDDDSDGVETGWTVGAGVDYAVTDNIFVRGEYRYADFGEVASNDGEELEFDSHTVRIGAGFKF